MRTLLLLVLACLLLAPLSAGNPASMPPSSQPGLDNACSKSPTSGPCKTGKFSIGNVTVGPGESRSYSDGTYTFSGTVHVQSGGSLDSHNATLKFDANAQGFIVDAGGTLSIDHDTLQPSSANITTVYALDLAASSTFTLTNTHVLAGHGIHLATSNADVHHNTLESIPRALFLDGVTLTIHDNTFLRDTIGINATGGQPTMDHNAFQSTHDCIRDYQTDPTITNNTFVACIIGIWHEQSHSYIALNTLSEDGDPGSIGIGVVSGNSPVIEGNDITNFTTGILIDHARAFVRNNTIHGNRGDGVRVVANSADMDIQGNILDANGGIGIHLQGTTGIVLKNNQVLSSGSHGIEIATSMGIISDGDTVEHSDFGFHVVDSNHTRITNGHALGDRVGVLVIGVGDNGIDHTNASQNSLDGFNLESDASSTSTLDHVVAMSNARVGVYAVSGQTSATNGWFEGNVQAGIANNVGNPTVDASCSYWGSATGPTTPGNPSGTGDKIFGDVQYQPFAAAPGASCAPVVPLD